MAFSEWTTKKVVYYEDVVQTHISFIGQADFLISGQLPLKLPVKKNLLARRIQYSGKVIGSRFLSEFFLRLMIGSSLFLVKSDVIVETHFNFAVYCTNHFYDQI